MRTEYNEEQNQLLNGEWTTAKKRNQPSKEKKPPREKRISKEEQRQLNEARYRRCPPSEEETIFRHGAWKAKRAAVRETMVRIGATPQSLEPSTRLRGRMRGRILRSRKSIQAQSKLL